MIECASKIDRVTVYARGAIVTRVVTLSPQLTADPCVLRISGISPLIESKTVRAKSPAGRSVLSVEGRWTAREVSVDPSSIQTELEQLEQKRTAVGEQRALVHARSELLRGAHPDPHLRPRKSKTSALARTKDALETTHLLANLLEKAYDELRALDVEYTQLSDAIAAAQLRLAQASAAQREVAGDPEYALLISLGAQERSEQSASSPTVEIEYIVEAARWWPTYKVRFTDGARKVHCSLDALVAQASGEDWSGVLVSVSTADLVRDARLPVLPTLRLGRAQPGKKAFRPPPDGLDDLFAGYDRAMATAPASQQVASYPREESAVMDELLSMQGQDVETEFDAEELVASEQDGGGGEEFSRAQSVSTTKAGQIRDHLGAAPGAAPYGGAAMVPPMPMSVGAPSPLAPPASRGSFGYAKSDSGAVLRQQAADERRQFSANDSSELDPGDEWLDFDALTLRDASSGRGLRGRLVRSTTDSKHSKRAAARQRIEQREGPSEVMDPMLARGAFDYRYDSVLRADIPGDSAIHRIAMLEASGDSKPLFRVVPKEAATVFREAEVRNPFDAPLLSGPAEVFYDDALLTRAKVATVDRGGILHIGLGVEERIRVARNTRVHEGSAGLLSGSTQMDHTVSIELSSSLGEAAAVTVIDRIPYAKKEDDVEVVLVSAKPKAEPYTQAERGEPVRGGLRWTVELAAGAKITVEFQYKLTFSNKLEIQGGNRRD
jgi:hypothetical protein